MSDNYNEINLRMRHKPEYIPQKTLTLRHRNDYRPSEEDVLDMTHVPGWAHTREEKSSNGNTLYEVGSPEFCPLNHCSGPFQEIIVNGVAKWKCLCCDDIF